MSDGAQKRISRLAVQSRRQEIEQRLGACGFALGPRRLFRDEGVMDFEQARIRRLRLALEDLGPIFTSFGLYMSARADLWPVQDCLELATLADRKDPTPQNDVRRLLRREIDCLPEDTFSVFEAKPFESRLLFQSHHGRLGSTEVIVKIIHPKTESRLLYDVDLLPLLRDSFAACGLSKSAFKGAVADFCHTIPQQVDFLHQARALETLAQDAEDYDALRAPQIYRSLCTSQVLVMEKLNGLSLDEVVSPSLEIGSDVNCASLESVGFERNELARLLCEVWLRQALLGRTFSVEPRPENILILPGKQIAFAGGAFAALPAQPQANLWDYLLAAANENSDEACSCLLKEMRKGDASERYDVRQRFRQAMPFRDGGWDASGGRQTLAELLFVHWRFASECGYVPLMHLPAFYRGLFMIADTARRVAPQIDPLAEGTRDLRLLAGVADFREMLNPSDLMDRYSALLVDLPQQLNDALSLAARGELHPKMESRDAIDQRRLKNSSAVSTSLLLLLAALSLLSRHLATSAAVSQWSGRIGVTIFLLLGAQVLRNAVRNK